MWNGVPCNESYITDTETDMGTCISFNAENITGDYLESDKSGLLCYITPFSLIYACPLNVVTFLKLLDRIPHSSSTNPTRFPPFLNILHK